MANTEYAQGTIDDSGVQPINSTQTNDNRKGVFLKPLNGKYAKSQEAFVNSLGESNLSGKEAVGALVGDSQYGSVEDSERLSQFDIGHMDSSTDLDDAIADTQSGFELARNAMANNLVTAATTALDGTIGEIYGWLAAAGSQEANGKWNNKFSNLMQDIRDYTSRNLYLARSSKYEDLDLWDRMKTGYFWANNVQSLGFTEGAILAGAAWSYFGAPGPVAQFMGASAEATTEAINDYREQHEALKKKLFEKYDILTNKYGTAITPDMAMEQLVKEYSTMEDDLQMAGNIQYAANVALLMLTNKLEGLDKFMTGGFDTRRTVLRYVKDNLKKVKTGEMSILEAIKPLTRPEATARAVGKSLLRGATEGFEEGAQGIISETPKQMSSLHRVESIFDAPADLSPEEQQAYREKNWVSGKRDYARFSYDNDNIEFGNKIGEFCNAMVKACSEKWDDTNWWEEIASGFVTGITGAPGFARRRNGQGLTIGWNGSIVNDIKEMNAVADRSQEFVNNLNERVKDGKFAAYYNGLARKLALNNKMEIALENNNKREYKNAEFEEELNDMFMFSDAGQMDMYKDMVKAYTELRNDDIAGITEHIKELEDGLAAGKVINEYGELIDKPGRVALSDKVIDDIRRRSEGKSEAEILNDIKVAEDSLNDKIDRQYKEREDSLRATISKFKGKSEDEILKDVKENAKKHLDAIDSFNKSVEKVERWAPELSGDNRKAAVFYAQQLENRNKRISDIAGQIHDYIKTKFPAGHVFNNALLNDALKTAKDEWVTNFWNRRSKLDEHLENLKNAYMEILGEMAEVDDSGRLKIKDMDLYEANELFRDTANLATDAVYYNAKLNEILNGNVAEEEKSREEVKAEKEEEEKVKDLAKLVAMVADLETPKEVYEALHKILVDYDEVTKTAVEQELQKMDEDDCKAYHEFKRFTTFTVKVKKALNKIFNGLKNDDKKRIKNDCRQALYTCLRDYAKYDLDTFKDAARLFKDDEFKRYVSDYLKEMRQDESMFDEDASTGDTIREFCENKIIEVINDIDSKEKADDSEGKDDDEGKKTDKKSLVKKIDDILADPDMRKEFIDKMNDLDWVSDTIDDDNVDDIDNEDWWENDELNNPDDHVQHYTDVNDICDDIKRSRPKSKKKREKKSTTTPPTAGGSGSGAAAGGRTSPSSPASTPTTGESTTGSKGGSTAKRDSLVKSMEEKISRGEKTVTDEEILAGIDADFAISDITGIQLSSGVNHKATDSEITRMFHETLSNDGRMFNETLFRHVFALARKFGITIEFTNEGFTGNQQGRYSHGIISLRSDFFATDLYDNNTEKARIILHELIHAVTSYAIEAYHKDSSSLSTEQREAVESIEKMFDQLKKFDEFNDEYGAKDTHEMLAELANPEFRRKINKRFGPSWFRRLIDKIKQFLGLNTENDRFIQNDLDRALYSLIDNYDENKFNEYKDNENTAEKYSVSTAQLAVAIANLTRNIAFAVSKKNWKDWYNLIKPAFNKKGYTDDETDKILKRVFDGIKGVNDDAISTSGKDADIVFGFDDYSDDAFNQFVGIDTSVEDDGNVELPDGFEVEDDKKADKENDIEDNANGLSESLNKRNEALKKLKDRLDSKKGENGGGRKDVTDGPSASIFISGAIEKPLYEKNFNPIGKSNKQKVDNYRKSSTLSNYDDEFPAYKASYEYLRGNGGDSRFTDVSAFDYLNYGLLEPGDTIEFIVDAKFEAQKFDENGRIKPEFEWSFVDKKKHWSGYEGVTYKMAGDDKTEYILKPTIFIVKKLSDGKLQKLSVLRKEQKAEDGTNTENTQNAGASAIENKFISIWNSKYKNNGNPLKSDYIISDNVITTVSYVNDGLVRVITDNDKNKASKTVSGSTRADGDDADINYNGKEGKNTISYLLAHYRRKAIEIGKKLGKTIGESVRVITKSDGQWISVPMSRGIKINGNKIATTKDESLLRDILERDKEAIIKLLKKPRKDKDFIRDLNALFFKNISNNGMTFNIVSGNSDGSNVTLRLFKVDRNQITNANNRYVTLKNRNAFNNFAIPIGKIVDNKIDFDGDVDDIIDKFIEAVEADGSKYFKISQDDIYNVLNLEDDSEKYKLSKRILDQVNANVASLKPFGTHFFYPGCYREENNGKIKFFDVNESDFEIRNKQTIEKKFRKTLNDKELSSNQIIVVGNDDKNTFVYEFNDGEIVKYTIDEKVRIENNDRKRIKLAKSLVDRAKAAITKKGDFDDALNIGNNEQIAILTSKDDNCIIIRHIENGEFNDVIIDTSDHEKLRFVSYGTFGIKIGKDSKTTNVKGVKSICEYDKGFASSINGQGTLNSIMNGLIQNRDKFIDGDMNSFINAVNDKICADTYFDVLGGTLGEEHINDFNTLKDYQKDVVFYTLRGYINKYSKDSKDYKFYQPLYDKISGYTPKSGLALAASDSLGNGEKSIGEQLFDHMQQSLGDVVTDDNNGNFSVDDPDINLAISKRNKETIKGWINKGVGKLRGMTDEQIDDILDLIDQNFTNGAEHLAVGKWFANGNIAGEEDFEKCRQALDVAKKAKVDPLRYESPMNLMESLADFIPSEKPIDPDTVPTLRNKRVVGNGIVVYDVDESEESRQNMRAIINTHFGKECSPWCLLQGDGNGNLTEASKRYWEHYNAYPKQVAFANGKLVAFCANDNDHRKWWDRQDEWHENIPVMHSIPGDKLGRVGTYLYNEQTGEANERPINIHKGNRKNGIYELWHDLEHIAERTSYKNGELDGPSEEWYPNGQIKQIGNYKDGRIHGIAESWYSNGVKGSEENYNNGLKEGKSNSWYEDGSVRNINNYKDGLPDGEQVGYFPNGQLSYKHLYINGKAQGKLVRYYENGLYEIVTTFKDGLENGLRQEWDSDGNLLFHGWYINGKMNGLIQRWYDNGQLLSKRNYSLGKPIGTHETWYRNGQRSSFEEFDNNGNRISEYQYFESDEAPYYEYFKTPEGEVYGYYNRKTGKIYIDKKHLSDHPDTPLHEYTHLWDRVIQKHNPELWARGVELMKETKLWKDIDNDSNYGKAWKKKGIKGKELDDLIASEVHARLVGDRGKEWLENEAKRNGSKNIIQKLIDWLTSIKDQIAETFGITKEQINKLSVDDFWKMTLRDFAMSSEIGKRHKEMLDEENESQKGKDYTVSSITSFDDFFSGIDYIKSTEHFFTALDYVFPKAKLHKYFKLNEDNLPKDAEDFMNNIDNKNSNVYKLCSLIYTKLKVVYNDEAAAIFRIMIENATGMNASKWHYTGYVLKKRIEKFHESLISNTTEPQQQTQPTAAGQAQQKKSNRRRIDDSRSRVVDPNIKYEKWNSDKETSIVRSILPNMSIEIVHGLLSDANGTEEWGHFTDGMVVISDVAAEGTLYHEAYHWVFNVALTEPQRAELYEEARKRWGEEKNDDQLEEEMAEAFREYMMTEYEDTSIGESILRFFRNLLKMIRGTNKNALDSMFRQIANGRFKDMKYRVKTVSSASNRNQTYYIHFNESKTFDNLLSKEKEALEEEGFTREDYDRTPDFLKDNLIKCMGL